MSTPDNKATALHADLLHKMVASADMEDVTLEQRLDARPQAISITDVTRVKVKDGSVQGYVEFEFDSEGELAAARVVAEDISGRYVHRILDRDEADLFYLNFFV